MLDLVEDIDQKQSSCVASQERYSEDQYTFNKADPHDHTQIASMMPVIIPDTTERWKEKFSYISVTLILQSDGWLSGMS